MCVLPCAPVILLALVVTPCFVYEKKTTTHRGHADSWVDKVSAMEGMISTLTLLCLVLSGVGAIQVVIPKDMYEYARGDNITLPCTFTPKPGSTPSLVIVSWSVEGLEAGAEEHLILTYYSTGVTDITQIYEGRVSVDVNIGTGKANLNLSSITLADNKNFKCLVQIPGDEDGKPLDTARLVVLAPPSMPICKIQGTAEYGQNINLTCVSEEGFPPPTYRWESRDVWNMPNFPDPRSIEKGGILSLFGISKRMSGFYTCTSRNKVDTASCNITLTVRPS